MPERVRRKLRLVKTSYERKSVPKTMHRDPVALCPDALWMGPLDERGSQFEYTWTPSKPVEPNVAARRRGK